MLAELAERGHKAGANSKFNSGAAPVMIKLLPNGVMEAGADPYAYRESRAW